MTMSMNNDRYETHMKSDSEIELNFEYSSDTGRTESKDESALEEQTMSLN